MTQIGNINIGNDNNDELYDEHGNLIVPKPKSDDTPKPDDNPPPTEIEFEGVKYGLDKDGNLLNQDGSTFKTKAEYEDLTKPVLVVVNDVEFKLDDKGNAINEQGEVVYTAEQLNELANPEEPYINKIINITGIPLVDDKGNAIEYEDSPLGISKYISDLSELKAVDKAEEVLNSRYEKYPILKQLEEHLILHGNIDSFKEDEDYSEVVLNENNELQLINIIVKEKMTKGETEESANELANLYKKEGLLLDKAKLALTYLDSNAKALKQSREAQVQNRQLQEEQEEIKYWKNVHSKVLADKKIQVGNEVVIIPDVIKRVENGVIKNVSSTDFFNYMYQPYEFNIDNYKMIMTRNEYDIYMEDKNSTVDKEIFEAYRRFVGYDDSKIVYDKMNTSTVNNLKKLQQNSSTSKKPINIVFKTKGADNINTR